MQQSPPREPERRPGEVPVNDRIPVVGIGASAGGLEACTRLLQHLPPDTGYAFVFVQHFDPRHPSSLSEILARATAMPVADATDAAPVARNSVYVIPSNTELTITDRTLRIAPRASWRSGARAA